MKTKLTMIVAATLLAGVALQARAQKGMGDAEGIARQAVRPEVVTISGTVLEVKTDRCELATGRSYLGTHVILKTSDGKELNVHLGPEVFVAHIAKRLTTDQELTVAGFHTKKMPENHYVAQTLTLDDKTIQVRDENLRPVWAGGRVMLGRGGSQWDAVNGRGQGRGQGAYYGQGRGQGRGPGYGRDQGRGITRYGQGRGQGRGLGYGQCWGQGRGQWQRANYGQGRGQGRGPGMGQGWNRWYDYGVDREQQ